MRGKSQGSYRSIVPGLAAIVIGAVTSVVVCFLSFHFGLPVYPDSIGTIGVSAIGGTFPGIVTAIFTDVVCTAFNGDALYFGFINAITAIYTAWYARERSFEGIKNKIIFVVVSGLISGGLSSITQWGLFGEAQNASLVILLDAVATSFAFPKFVLFIITNTLLNIFDKGISLLLVLIVFHFVPKDITERIKDSGWRQKPLSAGEIRDMELRNDTAFSIKRRMTIMLLVIALSLTTAMAWIGIRLYYDSAKSDRTQNAYDAVHVVADIIDADRIDEYIRKGRDAEGYEETEAAIYNVWKSAHSVEYLYVLTVDEDHVTFVFDMTDKDSTDAAEGYEPGDEVEIEKAFLPYIPALLAGEEIEPIDSNDTWSWLRTVYYPVYDSNGKCACYVGADVSLKQMAEYIQSFFLRVFLILAGFLILIIAFGLRITGVYTVYPIFKIVDGVDSFTSAGSDQRKLENAVRSLQEIDVNTSDEVEKLYHAICNMALNQTEQLRSIRRMSENTSKMQDGLIITMADLVENRDSDTGAHIQKTAAYVKIIVEGLRKKGYYADKVTDKFISDVVRSAPLHDIGKINIPDEVLNKPGKLNDEEYEIIKTHTTAGRTIMEKAIDTVDGGDYLKEARNMAAYHHERWDGNGYPDGLHGEVIPLSARIMAVADVFDALTSARVYKPAFPIDKALEMMQEESGKQFDPKCIEVFMDSLPEVRVIWKKYNEGDAYEA